MIENFGFQKKVCDEIKILDELQRNSWDNLILFMSAEN